MHRIVVRRMGNRRATGGLKKDPSNKSPQKPRKQEEPVMKLADIKSLLAAVTKSKIEHASSAEENKSLAEIMTQQDQDATAHQKELFEATKTKIVELVQSDSEF